MGSFLMPAQEGVNEKGFWEQEKIVSVHDRLLQYFGLSWDDPRHLPPDWWLQEFPQQCVEEICSIITEDMKANSLWAIKDPRICRLMPLWRLVFDRLDIEPFFLCIVRNPLEVAASLYIRDGMPKDLAVLLWLQHNLEAVDGTAAYKRRFIDYRQLLSQGDTLLRGILQGFSIDLDLSVSLSRKGEQFLSTELRHHTISDAELEADETVPGVVGRFFKQLLIAAESGEDLEKEDWQAIKQQYLDSAQLLRPWLNLSKKLQKDIADKNVAFEHLRHENDLISQALRLAEKTINNHRDESNQVHAALKEAQQLLKGKEARELELDAALKEAQQIVREREARERKLDEALKEAQTLVKKRDAENQELGKALETANMYVREREQDIAVLSTQVNELRQSLDRIEKHKLLGSMSKILIRPRD